MNYLSSTSLGQLVDPPMYMSFNKRQNDRSAADMSGSHTAGQPVHGTFETAMVYSFDQCNSARLRNPAAQSMDDLGAALWLTSVCRV